MGQIQIIVSPTRIIQNVCNILQSNVLGEWNYACQIQAILYSTQLSDITWRFEY